MNNIKLKRIKFNYRSDIQFKPGINYIQGLNGSGKTTIFNLIQYLLGLRKEFGYLKNFETENAYVEVEINGGILIFRRGVNNKEILVEDNHGMYTFSYNSSTYHEFIHHLLEPKYNFELASNLITSLVRESFISNSYIDNNRNSQMQKELNLLKLGVNSIYPKKIKTYIKALKEDISQKEKTIEQIRLFKQDVDFTVGREMRAEEINIEEITSSLLQKYSISLHEAREVFIQSEELYNKLQSENETRMLNQIDLLNPTFTEYLKFMNSDSRDSMLDLLDGYENGHSFGKRSLMRLLFEMTIQARTDITNGIGLLLNDTMLPYLDWNMQASFRELLTNTCKENDNFQYIEFVTDSRSIDRGNIVYELGKS